MLNLKSQMTLAELSQFYHQFATLDEAGISYTKTFEALIRNEKNEFRLKQQRFILEHLKKSRPLSEGFKFIKYLPVYDIPMIKAGEESGRLVEVFKILAQKYDQASQSEKFIRSQMFKPYFTFLAALFIPSFPDYFLNKVSLIVYLKKNLGILFIVSGFLYLIYRLWMNSFYDIAKARLLHSIQSYLPFFRGLSTQIALEKFASALSIMLESGMDIFISFEQASLCSADPEITLAVKRIIPKIRVGANMSHIIQGERVFSAEFATAINLGAESGKLPEFLRRYSAGLKREVDAKIKMLTKAIPIIMYWIVTAYVIVGIVNFYKGHLDEVEKVLEVN